MSKIVIILAILLGINSASFGFERLKGASIIAGCVSLNMLKPYIFFPFLRPGEVKLFTQQAILSATDKIQWTISIKSYEGDITIIKIPLVMKRDNQSKIEKKYYADENGIFDNYWKLCLAIPNYLISPLLEKSYSLKSNLVGFSVLIDPENAQKVYLKHGERVVCQYQFDKSIEKIDGDNIQQKDIAVRGFNRELNILFNMSGNVIQRLCNVALVIGGFYGSYKVLGF